jgi:lipid A 3-O-deacylase
VIRGALLAACGLLPALSNADSLQLTAQNDSGFGTDRGYTSGVRLSRLWGGRVAEAARFEAGIVQQAFTPDTKVDPRARVDRPYAARLLAFGARHSGGEGRLDTLEASAGVTGPSALGEQTQDFFHRFVDAPETDWSRQLHDRFDGSVGATATRPLVVSPTMPLALAGHAGASVGTVLSYVHAGAELRWGAADAPYSEALRLASTPGTNAGQATGFAAFAGASVRAVLRNRLLVRNPDDPGAGLEREDAVARYAAGASWSAAWGTTSFALVRESREHARQPFTMRFWSLSFALPLD